MTHTLDLAVTNLQQSHDALRELGERHAGYGVKLEHFKSVRDSFIWALAQTLGPGRWSRELEQSAGWVVDQVASVMTQSGFEESGSAPS